MKNVTYAIGIDVGLNSTGLAAIQLDDNGCPIRILKALSFIHDSGIDPTGRKTSDTRKKVSGVARRARRLNRTRRKRLSKLDSLLESLGYPIIDNSCLESKDSFEPWYIRGELADAYISDDKKRKIMLSVAIRHIARHRGWRNPYQSVRSMMQTKEYSKFYDQFIDTVNRLAPGVANYGCTIGQIVCDYIMSKKGMPSPRIRVRVKKDNKIYNPILPGKFMQSDCMLELRKIFEMQSVDDTDATKLLNCVFESKSPKGSENKLVGKDAITNIGRRASKASIAFQRYRIISTIANLRIRENSIERKLTCEEKQQVYKLLTTTFISTTEKEAFIPNEYSWNDVSELLHIKRSDLRGVGKQTGDGESITFHPPRLDSEIAIFSETGNSSRDKFVKEKLKPWWNEHTDNSDEHEAFIDLISNSCDFESKSDTDASAFIENLADNEFGILDNISLPSGRAAYSIDTLNKLSQQMLNTDDDLFEARKHLFNLNDNWRPSAEPISSPIGNPSVDRVLKIVNRFIVNATNRWGSPMRVNIEHVRSGFKSAKMSKDYADNINGRTKFRNNLRMELSKELGINALTISDADIRRYEAVQRQNGQCLYCGNPITFKTCEMDHIVPRKGVGSTNTRVNLAAVCVLCNRNKSNIPFAIWCKSQYCVEHNITVNNANKRVKHFIFPSKLYGNKASKLKFEKSVIARLSQTEEDEPFDNRSIESVAWMANELHHRIDWYYNSEYYIGNTYATDAVISNTDSNLGTSVGVYAGSITAMSRKLSGIDGKLQFFDAKHKTRFDRRHHAVDAAVIAMITFNVSQALYIKNNLRETQRILGHPDYGDLDWRDYPSEHDAMYPSYESWRRNMQKLLELLNESMTENRIPVVRQVRMRYENSAVHDDSINKLRSLHVSDAISSDDILRASTPALYCALVNQPDYTIKDGIPSLQSRVLRVNNKTLTANDEITFFNGKSAQIAVRGGSADIGNSIHHARLYRYKKSKKEITYGIIRVFQADLNKFRNEDLFTCELPYYSISMRYADDTLLKAIRDNKAEYIGYLLVGDELVVDPAFIKSDTVAGKFIQFLKELGIDSVAYSHWVIDGISEPTKIKLRPSMLSKEGFDKLITSGYVSDGNYLEDAAKVLGEKGWIVAVNSLASCKPVTIRRNGFGEIRWKSLSGMLVSWKWCNDSK